MEVYDSNKIEAIVFHADPKCALDCEGCYLRPHSTRINSQKPEFLEAGRKSVKDAATELLNGTGFKANQVIFACNTAQQILDIWNAYSNVPTEKLPQEVQVLASHPEWKAFGELDEEASDQMIEATYYNDEADGKSFIMAGSIDEFKYPQRRLSQGSWTRYSITNILMTEKVCNEMTDLINRNSRVDWYYLGDEGAYLMLHKPLCGEEPSELQIKLGRKLYKIYSENVEFDSVIIDRCISWSIMKQEFGCHAGVNLVNIHADGALTGCPYSLDVKTYLQDHETLADAVNHVRNLANSGEDYDWNKCKVKEVDWTDGA